MISCHQIKAARALLDWSQNDLAESIDVSLPTLRNIEKGGSAKLETLKKIKSVLELKGIEFGENDGVKRRSTVLRTLEGQEGYWKFYDDVYETVKTSGGEILVSNVDEREFDKWLGERWELQKNRMIELSKEQDFNIKILIKEGDRHFTVPEYAEYKWTPKDRFSEIPFYVYGNKLAIILFEPQNVSISIINNPKIASAYKKQFEVMWDQAIDIPKDQIEAQEKYESD